MINIIKKIFCNHDDELVEKVEEYSCIRGTQTYLRCKKCGRIKKHIFVEYEGLGYK